MGGRPRRGWAGPTLSGYGDGLNWYAYVDNDPANNTDPSGMVPNYNADSHSNGGDDSSCDNNNDKMKDCADETVVIEGQKYKSGNGQRIGGIEWGTGRKQDALRLPAYKGACFVASAEGSFGAQVGAGASLFGFGLSGKADLGSVRGELSTNGNSAGVTQGFTGSISYLGSRLTWSNVTEQLFGSHITLNPTPWNQPLTKNADFFAGIQVSVATIVGVNLKVGMQNPMACARWIDQNTIYSH